VVEKVDEVFADFLLPVVKEENDVLVGGHFFLEVLPGKFFLFCGLLCLFIERPFVLLCLLNEINESLFGMGRIRHEDNLGLFIDCNDTFLIWNGESSQGSLVLCMFGP
jgi:hypothetical protein